MSAGEPISVNRAAAKLVGILKANAATWKVAVQQGELGHTLIDAGKNSLGSIAAGRSIAEICMGGLGSVELSTGRVTPKWPWTVLVRSSQPVLACLASQYAGWKLSEGDAQDAYFALGSGPARALAQSERLFHEIGYRDQAETGTLVIEGDRPPPPAIVTRVAQACGLHPEQMTFIYAPTQSLAGATQVVARVLEVALHKAHELHFPLDHIVEGLGAAPLCPPHPDFVTAIGRTNDAIIYAGQVQLFVTGSARDAQTLAEQLPSQGSRDYGRPFAEIFRRFKGDFYAIDPHLFSPAEVIVTALETGQSFRHGTINATLLDVSFN
jgi:methenyltetrahydromethanopterin cyclohydrolase